MTAPLQRLTLDRGDGQPVKVELRRVTIPRPVHARQGGWQRALCGVLIVRPRGTPADAIPRSTASPEAVTCPDCRARMT